MHVPPGTEMYHTKMVTIPEAEHLRLKGIEEAYTELKLKYDTFLHEESQDAG